MTVRSIPIPGLSIGPCTLLSVDDLPKEKQTFLGIQEVAASLNLAAMTGGDQEAETELIRELTHKPDFESLFVEINIELIMLSGVFKAEFFAEVRDNCSTCDGVVGLEVRMNPPSTEKIYISVEDNFAGYGGVWALFLGEVK